MRNSSENEKGNKSKKNLKVILIAVVIAVILIIVGALIWFLSNKSQMDTQSYEISYKATSYEDVVYDEILEIYYLNNQVLITAEENTTKSQIEKIVSDYNGEIVGCIELTGDYQIEFDSEMTYDELQNLIDELEGHDKIDYVMINQLIQSETTLIPNDEEWEDEWDAYSDGLNWGIEAINGTGAWEYYDEMSSVKVGIIDSMFDTDHEDLEENFVTCWNNDYSQSYLDTMKNQIPLITFWENENVEYLIEKITNKDEYNHGTLVAGIVGGVFNNELGIAGTCPTAELYGYSMLNFGQDTDEVAYELSGYNGMAEWKYALALLITNDCKVINVSMASDEYYDIQADVYGQFLLKFIDAGYDFLIVQAAGNDNQDALVSGLFTGIEIEEVKSRIIVVGSISQNIFSLNDFYPSSYTMSLFSNYGDRVDILAPGSNIYSTSQDDNYDTESGTSFAAPYVSGVAAMCFAVNPDLTAQEVKIIITNCTGLMISDWVKGTYDVLDASACVEAAYNWETEKSDEISEVENYGFALGTTNLPFVTISVYECDTSSLKAIYDFTDIEITDDLVYTSITDHIGSFEIPLDEGTYYMCLYVEGYNAILSNKFEVVANECTYLGEFEFQECTIVESTEDLTDEIIDEIAYYLSITNEELKLIFEDKECFSDIWSGAPNLCYLVDDNLYYEFSFSYKVDESTYYAAMEDIVAQNNYCEFNCYSDEYDIRTLTLSLSTEYENNESMISELSLATSDYITETNHYQGIETVSGEEEIYYQGVMPNGLSFTIIEYSDSGYYTFVFTN